MYWILSAFLLCKNNLKLILKFQKKSETAENFAKDHLHRYVYRYVCL